MNTIEVKMMVLSCVAESLKLEDTEEAKAFAEWGFKWLMEEAVPSATPSPSHLTPVQ